MDLSWKSNASYTAKRHSQEIYLQWRQCLAAAWSAGGLAFFLLSHI